MKKKRHIRWRWYELLLAGGLLGLAICCTAWLFSSRGQTRAAQQAFEKLSQAVRPASSQDDRDMAWAKGVEALQAQNQDCEAWLFSEDTGLDYPVMYTPSQPEYYLRRGFDKQYSLAGTPFFDADSGPKDCVNLIVHGHNMKDGGMFAPLSRYLEKRYGLAHNTFELAFADGVRRYALMAVLHIQLMPENAERYYPQPQTKEEFDAFVKMLEQESLYCGGNSAQWGEQLLTLSTCDNDTDNGRILVIARAAAGNGRAREAAAARDILAAAADITPPHICKKRDR